MFRERIHDSPQQDDPTIKELLTLPSSLEPFSADVNSESEQDTITDEGGTHSVVSNTLGRVVAPAVAPNCNCAKEHLGREGSDESTL